MIFKVY